MSFPPGSEPPNEVTLSLQEAFELLGVMEDARDALLTTDHLVEVMLVSAQIPQINRRLGFTDPEGGDNGN